MDTYPGEAAITCLLLLLLHLASPALAALDIIDMSKCTGVLGMENGQIADRDLSASSSFDAASVGPQRARLKHDKLGGAWCPRHIINKDSKEYLEINLHKVHSLTAIQTQGRYGNSQGVEWAEEYKLEYWRPGLKSWVLWRNRTGHELIPGNSNTNDIVEQILDPFLLASKLRILPYSLYGRMICMRIELIGCLWSAGLVSYSTHQGVTRGTDVNLTDKTYDGLFENGRLTGGLGQLTDGQMGETNFRNDPSGYGRGYEWIGWRNDNVETNNHYVEIIFEFNSVRNFSSMLIHSNNMYSKDVQVFKHADVFFSIGGLQFEGPPVSYNYVTDYAIENARNVVVKLHNRVGRFLKAHLYFAAKWMMISEIAFDSEAEVGNYSLEREDATSRRPMMVGSTHGTKAFGDPLMGDEVLTTHKGIANALENESLNNNAGNGRSNGKNSVPITWKQYLTVVSLACVVFLLVAAVVFLTIKSRTSNPTLNATIMHGGIVLGIGGSRLDDDKEEVTYHEPYQVTTYRPPQTRRGYPQYGNVAQVTVHEYETNPPEGDPEEPRRPPPPSFMLPLPDLGLPELNLPVHIYDSPVFPSRLTVGPEQFYESVNTQDGLPPTIPLITAHTIKKLESKRSYKECERISWKRLKILHPIGEGQFGTVYMCEMIGKPGELVTVHALRQDRSENMERIFDHHVATLGRLKNPNVGKVMGRCRDEDKPLAIVMEQLYAGDLNEFLQNRIPQTDKGQSDSTLSLGVLFYMATQIASGMKYLEAMNYVHKDLATRNCLVGPSFVVKVSNSGIGRLRYPQDYYVVEKKAGLPYPVPIRWMPWESVFLEKFTTKSDIWAFGVTLWEIMTFGRIQPYEELSNMMMMDNLKQLWHGSAEQGTLQITLPNPILCSRDVYEMMTDCWRKSESARPNFREIHEFLLTKHQGRTSPV